MKKKMPWEPAAFEVCEDTEDIVTLSDGGEGIGNDPNEDEYS